MDYRRPLRRITKPLRDGETAFEVPMSFQKRRPEEALILDFICNRRLFGECYWGLLPEYFESMPQQSGALIRPFVPLNDLMPGRSYPGDVDLLVIPYENSTLVLSKALTVEVKAVRATFAKQGKSPNEFGFSQAKALLQLGFPHVAVGHLITSDATPPEHWRETHITKVIDANSGLCEPLKPIKADLMPMDLIRRTYGRLRAASSDPVIGLLAAYITDRGIWSPDTRAAQLNPATSQDALDAIAKYYYANADTFLNTLRHEPSGAQQGVPADRPRPAGSAGG